MSTLFKDSIVYSTYGETIAVGDMLYMSQGTGADAARTAGRLYKLEVANPDRNVFYGIAKESGAAADTNKKVVTGGRFDGLAGLAPGLPIYADPTVAGGVTQVRPSANVQVIGVAIDADSFSVNGALAGSFGAGEGSGGGVGGVDILFVQDFESAALGDFTQTGLVLSSVDPLKGAISANLVHDDTVNQSFKQVIAVDEKFRNRNITLKLNIKSAASAGNVTLTVRDETNAVNLVSSEQLPVSNDVGGVIGLVTFDVPSTCEELSYEIIALPEAGSPVTTIDDIIAELSTVSLLSTSVEVPIMEEFVDAGPITITATVTNPTKGSTVVDKVRYARRGDIALIQYQYQQNTAGTSGSGTYRFRLPAGLQIDGNQFTLSSGNNVDKVVGSGWYSTNGDGRDVVAVVVSATEFELGYANSVNTFIASGNGLGASSFASLSFQVEVPILGWEVNKATEIPLAQTVLVQEADSMVRLRGFNTYGSTATRIARFSSIDELIGSDLQYNNSATDGDSITVLEDGTYTFNFSFSANNTHSIALSRNPSVGEKVTNASALVGAVILNRQSGIPGNQSTTVSWSGPLNAGDTIYPHTDAVASNGGNEARAFLSASREGSLKQLNPNPNSKITIPTSELRMEGASTRGSTATAIVRFDNIAKIRGDAFTVESDATLGTRITMRKKGKLDVSVSLTSAIAAAFFISKNQQTLTSVPPVSESIAIQANDAGTNMASASGTVDVNIGDTIRVAYTSNPSGLLNSLNLSFQEQDISVSVTNTLPQFSESDSSVRVDTANGYGSSATTVLRFSNVRDNIGTAIEYVPSAVNGDSFVIKEDGLYTVAGVFQGTGGATQAAITKNTTGAELSADILTLAQSSAIDRVLTWCSQLDGGNNNADAYAGQYYLLKGDVIRMQANGASASNASVRFAISKVGKPNVTGVDVTPFVNIPRDEVEVISASGGNRVGAGLISNYTNLSSTNKGVLLQTASRITALKKCRLEITSTWAGNSNNQSMNVYVNNILVQSVAGNLNGLTSHSSTDLSLNAGDYVEFQVGNVGGSTLTSAAYTATATAASDNIISPTESFSTDTANLVYAPSSLYTLATLNTAPVGTFITFTYASGGNVRTQTTTAPTQTTSGMNVNGIQIFARAFNTTSTAAQPAAFAIQIGKGLKGKSLDLYKSAGKITAGGIDFFVPTSTNQYGLYFKDYNESTGILVLDGGVCSVGTNIVNEFVFSNLTPQNNGYLVINASKSPALTGVPLLQPRIATIKDVKASGTGGGTPSTGAYFTRVLNTLEDPTGVVTSLTSNQFTLPPGEYYIEATSPFAFTAQGGVGAKIKLRNVTDGVDSVTGTSGYLGASVNGESGGGIINLMGSITLSTAKVFEIQYRTESTLGGAGLGVARGYGDNEVYTQVKITKVK